MEKINPQNEKENNKNGGAFSNINEAFTAYMNAKTTREGTNILFDWYNIVNTFDDLIEFRDWMVADYSTKIKEDSLIKTKRIQIMRELNKKILAAYLVEIKNADSIEKIESLREAAEGTFGLKTDAQQIPVFLKWLDLAVTKPQLEKLLTLAIYEIGLTQDTKCKDIILKIKDKLDLFD